MWGKGRGKEETASYAELRSDKVNRSRTKEV